MAKIYVDGVPMIDLPENLDDTTPRPNATYSSNKIQGLIDTINYTKLEFIQVTELPTDDETKNKSIVFLASEYTESGTTYPIGLYKWYNNKWNKFNMEEI